jgi:PAS domain S-box-containing protein
MVARAIVERDIQRPLRALIVEDSEPDAELLLLELRRTGYATTWTRVQTAAEMRLALQEDWDVVLSDFRLPQFSALAALEVLRESGRDLPFIIVSGTIGEDAAVEALKAGAHDFLVKDRLARLGHAIDREVREASVRRERQAATALLDNLYETAPIGLAFLDRKLRYVRINEKLAAMTGLTAAEHIGRTASEVLPGMGGSIEDNHRRVLATGEAILNLELSGETPAAPGQRRHWLVNHYPVRDEGGAILGVGSVVVEITGQKRAEQALRESEARKTAILDSAFDGIIAIDERGHVIDFNPAAERMFGYRARDVIGKEMAALIIPERLRDRHRQGLARFLQTGVGPVLGKVVELQAQHADGTEFPVELAITQVEGREPAVFTGFVRDLSSRTRAEAERERLLGALEEAVRVRDEFLAIASHELRTPLTPLQLQISSLSKRVEELARGAASREWLQERFDRIARQGVRLERLVGQLLDVSRITSGRLHLDLERVDLAEVVRDVVDRLSETDEIARSGCTLTVDLASGVVGNWDRLRVEQVIENLLLNALKYGAGSPVTARAWAEGEDAILVVEDQGIGIQPADRERVFGRFERAVSSRHYGGLGMGLFIVRQVVEATGGTVAVQSEPGQGARFAVRLPLAGPPPRVSRKPPEIEGAQA